MTAVAVDTGLREREAAGTPVRVAMIGAGATGRAIALQLGIPVPGIRLVGVANRTAAHAERTLSEAGFGEWQSAGSPADVDAAVERSVPVLTDDPSVLIASASVDVVVEVTGSIDFAASVTLEAIGHRKHVVLVNAELDSLVGPVLQARAREAGVVLTNTDGDEPGVAMSLFRYLESLGLRPVAAGNIKGMVDHYRTPETQRAFAARHDQDVRKVTSFADATKLSMEATVLANATGFRVGRRGMHGPPCDDVRDVADLLPAAEMLDGGIVDYALGAAPHTGAFVVVHEDHPLRQRQLGYYKLGDGPFYTFYTPYHLPHIQIASTIGRAAVHGDPTVAPQGPPVCEVVAMAKRDLARGERLDGVGGFCAYGLIDNRETARADDALPIALSDGAVLQRDVAKDHVIRFADVTLAGDTVGLRLWRDQQARWPVPGPVSNHGGTS